MSTDGRTTGVTASATSYKHYFLAVLLVVLAFNSLDRFALGLVLQDIKVDLHLSDAQLGFLTGMAFAMFYAVLGVPIARWADRGNRVTIISLTIALWSVMVAACGLATTFAQLLLFRVGVAVGEVGCFPPSQSLISDYFTRAERPRAMAIYVLGGPLSGVLGYLAAGWLKERFGWHMMFVMLSLPGLLLAPLTWFTVREPRRTKLISKINSMGSTETLPRQPAQQKLKDVCLTLWANTTFRNVMLSICLNCLFFNGLSQWQPAFFIRSYGLRSFELGSWLAITYGVGTLVGTYLGGELASRYAANNERLQLKAMGLACGALGLLSTFVYLAPNRYVAFGLIGLANVLGGVSTGPLFATIQTLVPERQRATAMALIYLCANLIGMGLGPLAAGALSDAFRPWAGDESLRYALLALCPGYLLGGWLQWRASKTVMRDLSTKPVEETVSVKSEIGNASQVASNTLRSL